MKYLKIVLLLLLVYAPDGKAQDMHFTQFYSSPLYLNPAFAGAGACSRLSTTYRNQWPGITKTYQSYLFSIDHYMTQYNLGVGLLFASDVAGSGNLKTTTINPQLAYELAITHKHVLRFGMQPGLGMRSINFDNLVFGDQIARGGNVATIENAKVGTVYFDIGAGMLFYTKSYWAGVTLNHMNTPEQSMLYDGISKLPMKFSLHGGYKYLLNEDEPEEANKKSITGALNYRNQQDFDQLDIGAYYAQNIFNLGFWYRGIPGFKAYKPGYSNNDAVAVIVGVKADKLNIGYSYDFTISKLANTASFGSHEISLSYQLCRLKVKKKRLVVSCPKF
jgi:type IX secretion system PorP/SprF family membrane protein